ncbi:hypothetical protein [Mycolicibacterium cosmeticum]|uniref:hypothetical protein n=1 Tax=Mycolicibacterium cosmeticum TaxID=258533 RepID=UPI003204D513
MLKETQQLTTAEGSAPAERAGYAFNFAAAWLFSPPMADLLALFGEEMPPPNMTQHADTITSGGWLHLNEELPDWLERLVDTAQPVSAGLNREYVDILRRTLALERAVAEHFNFRGGQSGQYRERAQAAAATFDDALRGDIIECSRRLGLVDPEAPRHSSYDMTLVLGGGYKSPQLRSQLAANLAANGTDLGRLYFLGSPRFLIDEPPEAAEVAYYAKNARDEFDLMAAGAHRAFGLTVSTPTFLCGCRSADDLCPTWLDLHPHGSANTPSEYTHERRADLTDSERITQGAVLSASTHRPPYRPDTTDTFALWTRVANPRVGQRALVVTTQVFVPFQTFDGVKRLYLDHGVEVDAVGFGADWGDRPLTAEYVLQETLSAIRSARRMLVYACDILRAG